MNLTNLTAVSPVDGRYRGKINELAPYFSEFGLIRYRLMVEVEYFIALCEIPLPQLSKVPAPVYEDLRKLYKNFTAEQAAEIKAIERTTNHDVKAVEYFLKQAFDALGLQHYKEFIHFGLTSQDVNNTAVPLLLQDAVHSVYLPNLEYIISQIENMGKQWQHVPMLSRTHGQPASPTTIGKELLVFWQRLSSQVQQLRNIPFTAKFGGAVGNFNAHHVAYPHLNWIKFGQLFLKSLGLQRQAYTTQIEHYDFMAATFDAMKRINNILIDFSRDIWTYISMNYFLQKINANEVGSSTMPHKVNPIDFENAEGNLGMANAILEHLSAKLPISRLQRDLTDSTVSRNIGVPFAHTLIALKSLNKGIGKLTLNDALLQQDLEANWAVVTEAIQTVLRREGYPNPYEALKALSRTNDKITQQAIEQFIEGLEVNKEVKKELLQISPLNYTGIVHE